MNNPSSPQILRAAVLALLASSVTSLPAQTAAGAPASLRTEGPTVTLDPFTVNSEKDYGYRKVTSITTSRIGVSITEAPQAIEIISGELLSDFGINTIRDAFQYTSSVTKNSQEILQSGSYKLRGFELPTVINGLAQSPSPSRPGYIASDNIERIEVAKGPVGLFFGNSAPNGVANIITKRPQFINRTKVDLSAGSYDFRKALVDVQSVLSPKHGVAFRLIAASQNSHTRLEQDTSYNFAAGSFVVRPNDKIRIDAEFDVTDFQQTYAANNAWNFAVNPLYYENVTNPDTQMLNYIKAKYNAATDAAARQVINTRWGAAGPASFLNNWTADYFGAYGRIAYPQSGTTVNWNAISPQGDKFLAAGPDSNDDGRTYFADVSVTFTPWERTAIQYHWIHQANRQNFHRQLISYNSGPLNAEGHFPSLRIGSDVRERNTDSDAQQLDLSHELKLANLRHRLGGGIELSRNRDTSYTALSDLTRAPTRTRPDGTTTTGTATANEWYPFTQDLYPLSTTVASGIRPGPLGKPNEYQSWYASYRATAFEDKWNFLAGVRSVKLMTSGSTASGESELTKTIGVIGEVSKGLYAFASYNTNFVFSQGYTVNDNAGLPIPGEGVPLGSETGKGLEAGLKSTLFDGKITGTLSYFRIERDGVATSDIAKNGSDPRNLDNDPNNNVRWNLNGGLQRTVGFDGDAVWTPNEHFQVLANFVYMTQAKIVSDPSIDTANINVNENNARLYDKEFRHRLAKSPKFSANVVAKYSFTEGALKGAFVGGAVRHTGEYILSDNFNYDLTVNAETIYDAFAGVTKKYGDFTTTFQVNVQNIGDKINDFTRDDGFVLKGRVSIQF